MAKSTWRLCQRCPRSASGCAAAARGALGPAVPAVVVARPVSGRPRPPARPIRDQNRWFWCFFAPCAVAGRRRVMLIDSAARCGGGLAPQAASAASHHGGRSSGTGGFPRPPGLRHRGTGSRRRYAALRGRISRRIGPFRRASRHRTSTRLLAPNPQADFFLRLPVVPTAMRAHGFAWGWGKCGPPAPSAARLGVSAVPSATFYCQRSARTSPDCRRRWPPRQETAPRLDS